MQGVCLTAAVADWLIIIIRYSKNGFVILLFKCYTPELKNKSSFVLFVTYYKYTVQSIHGPN